MNLPNLCAELSTANVIDLSQTLEEHMPNCPAYSKFFHNLWSSYWHGGRSLTYQMMLNEHHGTHVDAPAHFISDAQPHAHVTIEHVPLTRMIGRGVRLDCRSFRAGDYVPKTFITAWETQHGPLAAGDIVLFDFGWAARWRLRPQHQSYIENWPGVGIDAAEYLIGKSVDALGVDTLSPDSPEALERNPIHPMVLEKQILIIENLCNLELLPDFFVFLALPLKIRAGSGSPIRAVGLI